MTIGKLGGVRARRRLIPEWSRGIIRTKIQTCSETLVIMSGGCSQLPTRTSVAHDDVKLGATWESRSIFFF